MKSWLRIACLLVLMSTTISLGCGDKVEVVTPPAPPALKQELERIAASGEPVGSGGQLLQEEIRKIKESDPAKGAALEKDLTELTAMQDPGEIKAKAAAMAASL